MNKNHQRVTEANSPKKRKKSEIYKSEQKIKYSEKPDIETTPTKRLLNTANSKRKPEKRNIFETTSKSPVKKKGTQQKKIDSSKSTEEGWKNTLQCLKSTRSKRQTRDSTRSRRQTRDSNSMQLRNQPRLGEQQHCNNSDLVSSILNTSTTMQSLSTQQKYKIPKQGKRVSSSASSSSDLLSSTAMPSSMRSTVSPHPTPVPSPVIPSSVLPSPEPSRVLPSPVPSPGYIEPEYSPCTPTSMDWEDLVEETHLDNDLNIIPNQIPVSAERNSAMSSNSENIRVVDTNVYLNSLNLVMMVRSEEILAVPWTVLQELDKLKSSTDASVSAEARAGNRWLQEQARNRNRSVSGGTLDQNQARVPGILFQKMSESSTQAASDQEPDDRILLYTLYLKDLYGDNVSLVTNDKNLATKAAVEDVNVFSSEELDQLYEEVQNQHYDHHDNHYENTQHHQENNHFNQNIHIKNHNMIESQSKLQNYGNKTSPCPTPELSQGKSINQSDSTNSSIVSNQQETVDEMRKVLHWFLEDLLLLEMKDVFGNLWKNIIKIKPKHTRPYYSQDQLFSCFKKHHIAVFSINFNKQFKQALDNIEINLRNPGDSLSLENWTVTLCNLVISRNKSGKEQAQICLDKFKHLNLNSRGARSDNCDNDRYIHHANQELISPTERVSRRYKCGDKMDEGESGVENVLTALTHTWHIISVVTQGLCSALNVEWRLETINPLYTFSLDSAVQYFPTFYQYVQHISGLYSAVMNSQISEDGLKNLVTMINRFKIELRIREDTNWADTPTIDYQQMKVFLLCEPEKVKLGWVQLNQFMSYLDICYRKGTQQII